MQAIIVAAGCSSRMGKLKPLLDINGYPMIAWAVMNFKNAGIKEICVVTGRDAQKIENELVSYDVKLVRNEAYQTTDMFTSIKMGAYLLQKNVTDGIFILPGDNPMVHPKTIELLKQTFERDKPSVLYPSYNHKKSHPPLIGKKSFQAIMSYHGDGGLRNALQPFHDSSKQLELFDKGTSLDADYPEDYANLVSYAKKHFGISKKLCEDIMDEVNLKEHIRKHTQAVADLALGMGVKLIENGYSLDLTLIESGALLHDLFRLKPHHALEGKQFFQSRGYFAIADVVGAHMTLEHVADPKLNEETIVFLADKLLKDETRISLKQHYELSLKQKNIEDPAIIERIQKDLKKAEKLQKDYEVITNEILSE